jgi:hypothetical protein
VNGADGEGAGWDTLGQGIGLAGRGAELVLELQFHWAGRKR